MHFGKTVVAGYGALFLGAGLFAGIFFLQMYGQYANLKGQEAESRQRLEETQRELREKEQYLKLLAHDPAFVEQVIRRKLHYARPDEVLFRFPE